MSHGFPRPPLPSIQPQRDGLASAKDVSEAFRRLLDWIMRGMMQGHLNTDLEVTLTANAATTVITDPRLSVHTVIGFMPLTANAAAEIGAGTLYVSARDTETATLTHANSAQTDRDFVLSLIG